jgi:hypothetical protein
MPLRRGKESPMSAPTPHIAARPGEIAPLLMPETLCGRSYRRKLSY